MENRITEIINDLFSKPEFADCFLIAINHKNEIYEVVIDHDDAVTLDLCKVVSRHIEAILDQEFPEAAYRLDVSSPGLDRPLKLVRQYKKNVGRDISVLLPDNSKLTGTLLNADDNGFTISTKATSKEGSKKVTIEQKQSFNYDAINQVKILIKF